MAVLNHRESPCRVWRNNVGQLRDARGIPITYGLGKGSADLIGFVFPTGQFLAVEIKTPEGRLSDEQKAWLATVRDRNGIAVVLRSVEAAETLVAQFRKLRPLCHEHDTCIEDWAVSNECAKARLSKVGMTFFP